MESIGVSDPYELLTHFVFDEAGAEEFAGEGPLVVDDKTILDFSVPKSKDSLFGMANLNNEYWLVSQQGRLNNAVFADFLRKLQRMNAHRRPVPDSVGASGGLAPAEFTRELEAANERILGPNATKPESPS